MKPPRTSAQMLAATLLALLALQQAAQACPGCKQTDGAPLNGASIGFGWGVLFMLGMVAGTLGYLGWMMYRSCQALAAQHRLAARRAGLAGA